MLPGRCYNVLSQLSLLVAAALPPAESVLCRVFQQQYAGNIDSPEMYKMYTYIKYHLKTVRERLHLTKFSPIFAPIIAVGYFFP